MTSQEVLDLVKDVQAKKAESQTIEVKAAHFGCPKRLYDTLSSFSNQDAGGIIVLALMRKPTSMLLAYMMRRTCRNM